MALFEHDVRKDELDAIVSAATAINQKPIATAATWPLATFRRTMRHELETFNDAKDDIRDRWTEWQRDPDDPEEFLKGADGKRVPTVVYAKNPDGSPRFRTDEAGEPTAEREINHGAVQITNLVLFDREIRALGRETVRVRVPHFEWVHVEARVKQLEPIYVEPLMPFFEGAPDLEDPADTDKDNPAGDDDEAIRRQGKAARRGTKRAPR